VNVHRPILIGLGLLAAMGCSGATIERERPGSVDPVVEMLHQGILELDGNIDELNRHIAELQQMPPVSDPRVQELRALDLSGWQLHLQQWILQREHLTFSVNQIQRVQANPGEKPAIGTQWTNRQQQFVKAMDDLRAQRQTLERTRLEVESQVLGRYFK
jgi:hypothetical protein